MDGRSGWRRTDASDLEKRVPVVGDDPRDRRRHRVARAWRPPASVGCGLHSRKPRKDRDPRKCLGNPRAHFFARALSRRDPGTAVRQMVKELRPGSFWCCVDGEKPLRHLQPATGKRAQRPGMGLGARLAMRHFCELRRGRFGEMLGWSCTDASSAVRPGLNAEVKLGHWAAQNWAT